MSKKESTAIVRYGDRPKAKRKSKRVDLGKLSPSDLETDLRYSKTDEQAAAQKLGEALQNYIYTVRETVRIETLLSIAEQFKPTAPSRTLPAKARKKRA